MKKTGGRKSRDTLPLRIFAKHLNFLKILNGQFSFFYILQLTTTHCNSEKLTHQRSAKCSNFKEDLVLGPSWNITLWLLLLWPFCRSNSGHYSPFFLTFEPQSPVHCKLNRLFFKDSQKITFDNFFKLCKHLFFNEFYDLTNIRKCLTPQSG